MAAAFGGEGEMGAQTGVAAVAVLVTEWMEAEEFEASGHKFALSSAVGADRLKVVVTRAPATDFKFEKQFGSDDIKQAGFGWMPFTNCVEVIRKALEGDDSITVSLTANGDDGVDVIIVVSMGFLHAEYRLSLERMPLLLSDKLSAHLRTAKKEVAALRSELEKAKSSIREVISDGDAAKQQMTEIMTKFAAAQKEIESLKSALAEMKSAMAKAASDSGAIIEELKEAVAKAKAAADKTVLAVSGLSADTVELEEVKSAAAVCDPIAALKKSGRTEFTFDTTLKWKRDPITMWETKSSAFSVSGDLKSAVCVDDDLYQIMMKPSLGSGTHTLKVQIGTHRPRFDVGFTDEPSADVRNCCSFEGLGFVYLNGTNVDRWLQRGGVVEEGDVWEITIDLDNGQVVFKSLKGEYTASWKPKSLPVYFGFRPFQSDEKLTIL